jgi:hypothetical protein
MHRRVMVSLPKLTPSSDRYFLHAIFTDPPAAVASTPQKKGGLAAAREQISMGFQAYCQ